MSNIPKVGDIVKVRPGVETYFGMREGAVGKVSAVFPPNTVRKSTLYDVVPNYPSNGSPFAFYSNELEVLL
ncbi:hypothetical protein SEA_SWITZERLAND_64 [Gordonia phage Switzerland]|uniref:Uncharacterized protein n=3 Tax=Soupsvirus TaxID=1982562 RepID=A0A160DGP2_9CAUD|nr:hypothetical protein BEN61_gp048 [Gordonia phage Rosalind]YP_009269085.1 hypothetical protein BEN62_gp045 [Gordonia phage KatherineG]YP_009269363.1 hypothetical protein BEN59_gp046 [Gordonia phage Soups]YP_009286005.1 hypothetical protein BIZ70_gp049 [Gordonia phage JSwag]YP_009624580.1 hypothetical protein FDJ48_gp045 [Gordonia phage Waits]ASZ73941.1 hypothetical protein SEA_SHAYRA_65 [Gordonia phage ShayRa]AXH47861.1 hypothetical protein SEA_LASTRESORT_63 [Gordonia phage LastResort]QDM5